MILEVPDQVLTLSKYSVEQFKLDIATMLYQKQVMSLGRAAEWAGVSRISFQKELKNCGIPIFYEVSDLHEELETLKKMGV